MTTHVPGVELFKTQRGMTIPTDVPTLEKIHPLLRPPHNVAKKNQFLNSFPFLLKSRHEIEGDKTQDCGRCWWVTRAWVDGSVGTITQGILMSRVRIIFCLVGSIGGVRTFYTPPV